MVLEIGPKTKVLRPKNEMKPDRDKHEHLLDGCLDEVLGGRTPPDLTARIM